MRVILLSHKNEIQDLNNSALTLIIIINFTYNHTKTHQEVIFLSGTCYENLLLFGKFNLFYYNTQ